MATLSLREIEQRVTQIAEQDEFAANLLLAYGRAQSNATRRRKSSYNVAEDPSRDYAQKNIVYFRPLADGDAPLPQLSARPSFSTPSSICARISAWPVTTRGL